MDLFEKGTRICGHQNEILGSLSVLLFPTGDFSAFLHKGTVCANTKELAAGFYPD